MHVSACTDMHTPCTVFEALKDQLLMNLWMKQLYN